MFESNMSFYVIVDKATAAAHQCGEPRSPDSLALMLSRCSLRALYDAHNLMLQLDLHHELQWDCAIVLFAEVNASAAYIGLKSTACFVLARAAHASKQEFYQRSGVSCLA